MAQALRVVHETRVGREFGLANGAAKTCELRIVEDADEQFAVGRAELVIGHDVRVGAAQRRRHLA
ncbi:hypothetical protein D3C86_2084160 [compost metagenome]